MADDIKNGQDLASKLENVAASEPVQTESLAALKLGPPVNETVGTQYLTSQSTSPTHLSAFSTRIISSPEPVPPQDVLADDSPETSVPKTGLSTRQRSDSFSQWTYDFDADDSDSDDEVYATPPEGLSEVEEEDEDEDESAPAVVTRPEPVASVVTPAPPIHKDTMTPTHVEEEEKTITEPTKQSTEQQPPAKSDEKPDMDRHQSSSQIERATVTRNPNIHTLPKIHAQDASAYLNKDQEALLQPDIKKCQDIIHLFLTSRMKEAETLCYESDPEGVHMYIGTASAVIQTIKAMMTFDKDDLKEALEIAKTTSALANTLRKPSGSVAGRLAGFVRDRSGVAHVKAMNIVQKHAELVYAETLLIKAVLGIVAGGDWVGLIKEA